MPRPSALRSASLQLAQRRTPRRFHLPDNFTKYVQALQNMLMTAGKLAPVTLEQQLETSEQQLEISEQQLERQIDDFAEGTIMRREEYVVRRYRRCYFL